MSTKVGPDTFGEERLRFAFDLYDTKNSYLGEPTSNLAADGGLGGMSGITLNYLGKEDGWKKYSMEGTFTGGGYPYIMYITWVQFTGGVTYSSKCTIKTNVRHKFNYFGGSGLSYVNEPKNIEGTSTATLNPDGSYTEYRIGFQYTNDTGQVGYLYTNPINNTTFYPDTDFVWVKEVQVERNSHNTQFVDGNRSNTASLLDLANNATMNVSTVSYNSSAQPVFDGTDDYIDLPAQPWNILKDFTLEAVFKANGTPGSGYHVLFQKEGGYSGGAVYGLRANQGGQIYAMICYSNEAAAQNTLGSGSSLVDGRWYHIVSTFDSSFNWRLYINGVLENSTTLTTFPFQNTSAITIGQGDGRKMNGELAIMKIYSRVLSENEIATNFGAVKQRFNI